MGFSFKESFKKLTKLKKLIILMIIFLCVLLPVRKIVASIIPGEDAAAMVITTIMDAVFEATMTILFIILIVATVIILSNAFLALGAALLAWAIALNTEMLLTRCGAIPCIVDAGWKFTLGLANMFFILALTFIAFATILGIETYGMKKMLVPLILIALAINFSQLFMGIMVDFASGFMQVFAEPILNWMDVLGQSLKAQGSIFVDLALNLISPFLAFFCKPCGITYMDPLTAIATFFIKILTITAHNIIAGIMFVILAGIFLLRIPMIWILTIIAPMGLVCYLFPFLRSKYRWWIKQVGQWVFIGIFALFFIYLGSRLWEIVWSPTWAIQWGAENFGTGFLLGDLGGWFVRYILPSVIFLLFLFLALHFTKESSAIFAGAMIGVGMWASRKIRGTVQAQLKAAPKIGKAWKRELPGGAEREAKALKTRAKIFRGLRMPWLAEPEEKKWRKATIGALETSEKTRKDEAPSLRARKYDELGDSFEKAACLTAEPKDLGAVKSEWGKMGWSDDKIDEEIEKNLSLLNQYAPGRVKSMIKVNPSLARTSAGIVATDASNPDNQRKVLTQEEITRYKQSGMLESETSMRQTLQKFRSSSVTEMDPKFYNEFNDVKILLKYSSEELLKQVGRTQIDGQRKIQEYINTLGMENLKESNDYRHIARMFENPNSRNRLEGARWERPPDKGRVPTPQEIDRIFRGP